MREKKHSPCLIMLNTSYFGIGMENVYVLLWMGMQRLVLHLEMECKNLH